MILIDDFKRGNWVAFIFNNFIVQKIPGIILALQSNNKCY